MTIAVTLIGTTSSNSSVTQLQVTGTVGAGDSIVCYAAGPSDTTFVVSDNLNAGNYSQKRTGVVGGAQGSSHVKDSSASGSITVTMVPNGGSSTAFVELWAFKITGGSGFASDSAINVQTTGTSRATNSLTPGSQPGGAIIWLYNDSHNEGTVSGGGFSAISGGSGSSFGTNDFFSAGFQRYTALSALTGGWSVATSGANTGAFILSFNEAAVNPALGSQTATFSQGTFSASNNSPTQPVTSAPWPPMLGNPRLGPLGLAGFALRESAQVQAPANTVSLGAQTATFTQGTFSASSTGNAALGSQTATFSQGAFTANTSGGGTVGIGSQTATFSQGTFTASGGPLPSITCSGGTFDALTPMPGLTL